MLTIHHDDEAGFLADQELFHNNAMAGLTESIARKHVLAGIDSLLLGLRQDDTLAGCQAISLDDDRCTLLFDVGNGFIQVGKVAIGGGRNPVARQEILGEGLGALKLGSRGAGTENTQAGYLKTINDTRYQWHFRTNDGQAYGIFTGEVQQRVYVFGADIDILQFVFCGSAGIARRYVYRFYTGGLCRFPGQCVLAAATADYQYFHWLSAGSDACR